MLELGPGKYFDCLALFQAPACLLFRGILIDLGIGGYV